LRDSREFPGIPEREFPVALLENVRLEPKRLGPIMSITLR